MSDEDPNNALEKRNPDGTWAQGGSPKSPGRPKLPAFFKERGPNALRMIVAQATGEALPGDDGAVSAAVAEVAASSSTKERGAAAIEMANRIYGKAPETLTLEGGSPILDMLVGMAKPVTSTPKE
jgi:hypothetical protein